MSTFSGSTRSARHARLSLRMLLASVFCLTAAMVFQRDALAEWADANRVSAYEAALNANSARQIFALEGFLATGGNDALTTSALEILVWDYLRTGATAQAVRRADALLAADPGNAIALAALVDPSTAGPQRDGRERFRMATRGLAEFGRLQKPLGMTTEEFYRLRLRILSTLDGEAGLGYLDQSNYSAAQQYLQQAVASAPNSGRYVYGLALAMLRQKPPQDQGYWYLARAVNLFRGTPEGSQIGLFARKQYANAGGSDGNWDRFLIAAAGPTSATRTNAARFTTPSSSNLQASIAGPTTHSSSTRTGIAGATAPTGGSAVPTPVAKPPDELQIASIAVPRSVSNLTMGATPVPVLPPSREPTPSAANSSLQLPPTHKKTFVLRDHPLSLGILIQKARLTNEDRNAILFALSDLIRHLRQDDEVFVMGFSNELEFEQDLTRNEKLLERAIAEIKPQSGAALLDAVAFAAGHLDRIAKNRNRVLLVISDGSNAAAHFSSSEINGVLGRVQVNCIGMDVDDTAGMNLLQSLAAYSGGQTTFATGPKQFRAATWEFAKSMGIEFPY
jgi:tetratricopeptide (TPR) repeat protein